MHAQRVGPEGGDKEAKLHNLGVQPTSAKRSFRCVADGEHVLAGVRAGSWHACTCSPLTAALRSTRCCTALPARPQAPPPSATRRRRLIRRRQPLFSTTLCSSHGCAAAPGGYEAASRAACSVTTTTLAALAARQLSLAFRQLGRPARASPAALRGAVPPANRACCARRCSEKKCAHVSARLRPCLHA